MSQSLQARYEARRPSSQTVVDIFKGTWKSKLPEGLQSGGKEPMFEDKRPAWFNGVMPGGFDGKSVLELGPFEGYQTVAMERLGAEVTSVEGNSINFLKCLCLKEALGLKARMLMGDIIQQLAVDARYDVVWASGVLYHLQDPIRMIELSCARADAIYVWTHYYDGDLLRAAERQQRAHFVPKLDRKADFRGRTITLHARHYLIDDYEDNIPLHWEGGPANLTYWMELPDIEDVFERCGFSLVRHFLGALCNGLPVVSFAAHRKT